MRKAELLKLELQAIDEQMALVPELPKNWDKWMDDVAMMKHQYLIYTKEKRAYCTHCKEWTELKIKPKHNETGKCPMCRCEVTYKSWNKQKYLHTRTKASIIQKCKDGKQLVVRQYAVYRRLRRDEDYIGQMDWYEEYRGFTNENIVSGMNAYEKGTHRSTGEFRWCRYGTVNHGGYYFYTNTYASSVLYTANLTRVLKHTVLRYLPVAEMFKVAKGKRIDVEETLTALRDRRNFYESAWKMGLHRFVADRLFKVGVISRIEKADKPWNCLQLPKETFMQAVRLNASDTGVRILQTLNSKHVRVTDDELKWLETCVGSHSVLRYFHFQTPHRFIKYMSSDRFCGEDMSMQEASGMYVDYLSMVQELDRDLHDRSVCFPQDMRRAHDEAAVLLRIKEEKEEADKRKKEEEQLKENAQAIREVFDYSDEYFFITVPETYREIAEEGHAQHNCVARYFESAADGSTIIFFVRRKEEPEKSFCTVEIGRKEQRFVIRQNYTAYNKPAPDDEKAFLEKAVAAAQKKVDKELKKKAKQVRVAVAV